MVTPCTFKRYLILLKFIVLLSIYPLLASCIPGLFPKLSKGSRETATHNFVFGTISDASGSERVIVVAFTFRDGRYIYLAAQRVDEMNCFFFALPQDEKYGLVAFADRNGNGRYDPGEPAGAPEGGDGNHILKEPETGTIGISVQQQNIFPPDVAHILVLGRKGAGISIPLHVGRVTRLDEEQVAARRVKAGQLTSAESRVGVLFLEPYAPEKIPIIFINGFGGCPQDWRYFVDSIDRRRFQPWFFYYPSGMRLHDAATVLDEFVAVLHRQHQFDTLFVTAHSMGGLIARDFILQTLQRNEDYIKLYVSISTPWLGHESAEIGVKYAPVVVPSWIDMVPDSDFQRSLFTRQLPPDIRYFLLFGYRGKGGDGVVSLASQLRPEAQKEAERVYGYDESHVSILASKEVLATYRELLSDVAANVAQNPP